MIDYGLLGASIFIMCITAPIGYGLYKWIIEKRK